MNRHYVYFKNNRLCRFEIIDKTLYITDFSKRELFFIKLYISSLLKRNDFNRMAKVYDDHIEYHLKPCDIMLLTKEGFPYYPRDYSSCHFFRHEFLVCH